MPRFQVAHGRRHAGHYRRRHHSAGSLPARRCSTTAWMPTVVVRQEQLQPVGLDFAARDSHPDVALDIACWHGRYRSMNNPHLQAHNLFSRASQPGFARARPWRPPLRPGLDGQVLRCAVNARQLYKRKTHYVAIVRMGDFASSQPSQPCARAALAWRRI